MTYADKLIEKIKSREISISGLHPFTGADITITPDPFLENLVSAFLEKDEENEKKALDFVKAIHKDVVDEYDQIRLQGVYNRMLNDESFREFVEACKKGKK